MENSIPESKLVELVAIDGEQRVDSRLIAKGVGLQHESIMKTIRKYKTGIEKYGVLRFEIGKPIKGSVGGRPEQYCYLNKEQFGYLLMWVRVNDTVRAFREDVYDKFLAYEKQQPPASRNGLINSLWVDRLQLFFQHTKIPHNMFCIFEEISLPLLRIETTGYEIPIKATPDSSVGRHWAIYARDVLKLDMSLVQKYPHRYPDHRGTVEAYLYPLEWQSMFTKWFREVYVPVHLPEYLKYLKASKESIVEILKAFGVHLQIKPGKEEK